MSRGWHVTSKLKFNQSMKWKNHSTAPTSAILLSNVIKTNKTTHNNKGKCGILKQLIIIISIVFDNVKM